jgi:hypothetical protein
MGCKVTSSCLAFCGLMDLSETAGRSGTVGLVAPKFVFPSTDTETTLRNDLLLRTLTRAMV